MLAIHKDVSLAAAPGGLENEMKDRIKTERGKEYQQFRRRFQNGVEILERESVSTITVDGNEFKTVRQPRLIVNDAVSRSRKFIAKSKSQLGEINNVLQDIIHQPIGAK